MDQYMIITGNPIDGLTFFGPFADKDAALDWGAGSGGDWWLATLEAPDATP